MKRLYTTYLYAISFVLRRCVVLVQVILEMSQLASNNQIGLLQLCTKTFFCTLFVLCKYDIGADSLKSKLTYL